MPNELTAKINLIGTAANFGDALALSQQKSLNVTKDVAGISKTELSTVDKNIALAASYGKSYVYLRNVSEVEAEVINISFGAEGLVLKLENGEFAFFPWSGVSNIVAAAASGTPFLEYAIFES